MEYRDKNLKYTDAEAYDRRAESSVLERYVLGFWHPFLKNKIREFSAGKTVIDWGCGTGEYALAAKEAKKIYCIDISTAMLLSAKEKLKHFNQVEFIHGSGFKDEIVGGAGELILTIGVWEYVDPIKLFEEIKRLTRKGSRVIVVFPNIYNLLNLERSAGKMSPFGGSPEGRKKAGLRPGFIKKLFKNEFKILESESFGMVCWCPKKIQFLVLPFWKLCDFIWRPFQKFLPLGINVYYLFERK